MKRALAALLILALAGVGGALAYQAANRERDYRALLGRMPVNTALSGGTFGKFCTLPISVPSRSMQQRLQFRWRRSSKHGWSCCTWLQTKRSGTWLPIMK